MSWQWLLRPLSLEEVLEQVRRRSDEERLFLVEQALRELDPARRRRALTNAAYREPGGAQLALWCELGYWLEDAGQGAADEGGEGETREDRLRALADSLHRLDAAGKRELWEQLSHAVGAVVPARERYGDPTARARLPSADRDALLLELEPEALHDPRSVFYARRRYCDVRERLLALRPALASRLGGGARLLEIGPGEHAGVAALFAARGARVTVVDVEPLLVLDDLAYYERLMAVMDRGGPFDWSAVLDFEDGAVRFLERLEYRAPVPEPELPVPDGSLDAAYSGAVLEHVRDLDGLARELFRVLAPGAPMVHLLDLSDHRLRARDGPLSHLCMGDDDWKAVGSDAGYPQSRRLAADYRRCFERAGFEVKTLDVLGRAEITDDLRARLHPVFAVYDDETISPLDVFIGAVKPG